MLDLLYCELLKLKRAKMLFLSMLGALATPVMMLLEALQTHFEHPERVFTLANIYNDSLLYVMLLMNMLIYVAITAYLFSREYTERTLKTILPIPVRREKLVAGKFCALLLWIMLLTFVTWAGILALSALYHAIFGLTGFSMAVAGRWLLTFFGGGLLMFLTVSPFAFLAQKTKSLVAPMILSAGMVMGSAALCNQDLGALYPWTATFFLVSGRLGETGYAAWLSVGLIALVSLAGFLSTFLYFKREDIK